MRVELLTPLHIGTGIDVPEYEYQEDHGRMVRLNLATLLADPLVPRVGTETCASTRAFADYLKTKAVRERWPQHTLYQLAGTRTTIDRDVRECVKTSLSNKPLLPGSSLKGPLLTAWRFGTAWRDVEEQVPALRGLLTNAAEFTAPAPDPRLEVEDEGNPEWGFWDKKDRWVGRLLLSDRLRIPDVEFSTTATTDRAERMTKRRGLIQVVEYVRNGAQGGGRARFHPSADKKYSVAELCRRANLFALCLLVAETQFFGYIRKKYEKTIPAVYQTTSSLYQAQQTAETTSNSCLVRVGWASSKNATSLTLLYSEADLRKQPRPGDPTRRPKSRWLLPDDQPFGWCLLTFEEADHADER